MAAATLRGQQGQCGRSCPKEETVIHGGVQDQPRQGCIGHGAFQNTRESTARVLEAA